MVTRCLSYGLGDNVHTRRSVWETVLRGIVTYIAFSHAARALETAVQQCREKRSVIARSDRRYFSMAMACEYTSVTNDLILVGTIMFRHMPWTGSVTNPPDSAT